MKTLKKPNEKYEYIFTITGNRKLNLETIFMGNMSLILLFVMNTLGAIICQKIQPY